MRAAARAEAKEDRWRRYGAKALIEVPDADGILSLVQASQGIFLDSDNICVTAKKGDMAPINGHFNGREIASGTVAMESGTFCVDESTLALVQRSWGLSSEQEFDEVVKKKTKKKEKAAKRKEEKKVQKKVAKAKGEKAKKKVVKDEKKKVEKATAAKKKKKEVAKEEKKVENATAA